MHVAEAVAITGRAVATIEEESARKRVLEQEAERSRKAKKRATRNRNIGRLSRNINSELEMARKVIKTAAAGGERDIVTRAVYVEHSRRVLQGDGDAFRLYRL